MITPATQEWAAERLREAGIEITGPAEELGTRAWSSQFRVPTRAGHAYFKASPPAFGHEAALTRALGEWCPGDVPEVLAADTARNWLLTADFGAGAPGTDPWRTVRAYAEMIPAFARIQVAAAGRIGELRRMGCRDHRLERLGDLFDELVTGPGARDLLLGGPHGLTPVELAGLARLAGPFRETCRRLAESAALPETLVHADLWRGNFLLTARGPVIFDWAESMIAHPFGSLEVMLGDVRALVPGDEGALGLVTRAYLREWSRFDSRDRLAEAARLVAAPALVSRALMWRDAIAGLGPVARRRYEGTVAQHLRDASRLLLRAG